jgi:hypothetical protein
MEQAIQTIIDGGGSHFDPDLIGAFRAAVPDMILVHDMYREDANAAPVDPARTRPVTATD